MSAQIISGRDVAYLLETARAAGRRESYGDHFRWYYEGQWRELKAEDCDRVGQLLWDENLASVSYRYPKDFAVEIAAARDEGGYVYRHPVQALVSLDYYEYQSCEHPGWKSSEAHAFVAYLKDKVIRLLPGYGQAVWGTPEPAERFDAVAAARA